MKRPILALAAAALVAVALAGAAPAAGADCTRLRVCAGLTDDENRLACFDGVFSAVTEPDKPSEKFWGPPDGKKKPAAKPEKSTARPARTPKMTEKRHKGLHCVSVWDGSHSLLKRHVRRLVREPDSFEHIATQIWPVSKAGTHRLRMRFRARNGFGGMSVASVLAEIENDGCAFTILETVRQ